MSVLIEKYRGVEIVFSPENERFSYSFDLGSWNEKQSYASCKKSIDDYFKNNETFKPFKVRNISSGKVVEITGIRKDGRFVYDTNGKKEQMSEYYENDYIELDESHESIYAQIAALECEIDNVRKKISAARNKVTGKTLKEIKKEMFPC